MNLNFNTKVLQATKWSTFAEITAKLFSPIATMFLARLLVPEAFGTIATITVVISFTEVFTETGFQKYLIQRDFKSQDELIEHSDVAFVSNLIFAFLLSSLIIMYRNSIAGLLGNETLGLAIAVSCVSIPLSAFSSLQTALFKRQFDFKTLFGSRLLSLVIPLVITVPVALLLKNYWALIAGTLTLKCVNAIYLTLKTNWKPRLYFRVKILKEMSAFTSWTILESCFIWLSSYAGILLVGIRLDEFYLGLYATSITLVTQILGVGISAVTPILFSALSRLQNNADEFNKVYLLFQSSVALVVIPIGALLYSYNGLITRFFLGEQWNEAAGFVGLLGLTTSIAMVFSHLASEVFRAKARPGMSLLLQVIFLLFFIPLIWIATRYGFKVLYMTHSFLQLVMIIFALLIMNYAFGIKVSDVLKGTALKILAAFAMFIFSLLIKMVSSSYYWEAFSILLSVVFYFVLLVSIKKERDFLLRLKGLVIKSLSKSIS